MEPNYALLLWYELTTKGCHKFCPGLLDMLQNPIMYDTWGDESNIFSAWSLWSKITHSGGVCSPDFPGGSGNLCCNGEMHSDTTQVQTNLSYQSFVSLFVQKKKLNWLVASTIASLLSNGQCPSPRSSQSQGKTPGLWQGLPVIRARKLWKDWIGWTLSNSSVSSSRELVNKSTSSLTS